MHFPAATPAGPQGRADFDRHFRCGPATAYPKHDHSPASRRPAGYFALHWDTIDGGEIEIVDKGGTDLGALVSVGTQDVFGYASGATVFCLGYSDIRIGWYRKGTTGSNGDALELLGGRNCSATSTISVGGISTYWQNQRPRFEVTRGQGTKYL